MGPCMNPFQGQPPTSASQHGSFDPRVQMNAPVPLNIPTAFVFEEPIASVPGISSSASQSGMQLPPTDNTSSAFGYTSFSFRSRPLVGRDVEQCDVEDEEDEEDDGDVSPMSELPPASQSYEEAPR